MPCGLFPMSRKRWGTNKQNNVILLYSILQFLAVFNEQFLSVKLYPLKGRTFQVGAMRMELSVHWRI